MLLSREVHNPAKVRKLFKEQMFEVVVFLVPYGDLQEDLCPDTGQRPGPRAKGRAWGHDNSKGKKGCIEEGWAALGQQLLELVSKILRGSAIEAKLLAGMGLGAAAPSTDGSCTSCIQDLRSRSSSRLEVSLEGLGCPGV